MNAMTPSSATAASLKDPSFVAELTAMPSASAIAVLLPLLHEAPLSTRLLAVEALGRIPGEATKGILIELLGDSRRRIQIAAAEVLDERGDHRALAALLHDHSGDYCSALAHALGTDAVPAILHALESGTPGIRRHAVAALASLKHIEGIGTALNCDDWSVRVQAASTLAHLPGENATRLLLSALDDEDERVVAAVLGALAAHPSESVLKALFQHLGARDPRVRIAAASSLHAVGEGDWPSIVHGDSDDLHRIAETGDLRVLPALAFALHESRWDWRMKAVEAAFALPEGSASELLKSASHDSDNRVASAARNAKTGPIAHKPSKKPLRMPPTRKATVRVHKQAEVVPDETPAHHPEQPEVRHTSREVTPSAAVVMLKSNDPGERIRGAMEIARLKHTESLPRLLDLLRDPVAEVKVATLSALVAMGDKRALMPALALTGDRNGSVRKAATDALRSLGAFEFFREGLTDKDSAVRKAAIENLGKLGDERAIPLLIDLLTDEAAWRDAAATALGRLGHSKWDVWINGDRDDFFRMAKSGDPAAIQIVAKAAASPSAEIRKSAAEALGFVDAATAFPVLLKLLPDRYEFASIAAITSLGQLGDRRAVPALTDLLADMNWLKRTAAAIALGRIGSQDSVGPLIAALRDETGAVRREAASSLAKLMDSRAVDPLVPLLYDSEQDVQDAAREAMKKLSEGLGAKHKAEVNKALWALMEASNYYRSKKAGVKEPVQKGPKWARR